MSKLQEILSVASTQRHSGVGEVALFEFLQAVADHLDPPKTPEPEPAEKSAEPMSEPEDKEEKSHGHSHKKK